MEQHTFPQALLIIKKVRAREGWFYLILVVNIDTGLESELLRQNVLLGPVVVLKTEVVRATDGQIFLPLTALIVINYLSDFGQQIF